MLDNDDSITVTVSSYAIICWPVVNYIINVFISASNGIICFWYREAFVWNTGSVRPFQIVGHRRQSLIHYLKYLWIWLYPPNFQIYNNVNSIFTRNHICIRLHNRCEFYSSKSVKISSFCCSEMPSSRIIPIKNSFCFDWRLACHHQVGPKKHWMRLLIISFYVHYMALNLLFSQEHFVKRFIF